MYQHLAITSQGNVYNVIHINKHKNVYVTHYVVVLNKNVK
jgi:hypothetical protein